MDSNQEAADREPRPITGPAKTERIQLLQDSGLPVDRNLQFVGCEQLGRVDPNRGLVDCPLEDRIEGFLFGQDSALEIKSFISIP